MATHELRRGDRVEVRTPSEILATLDADASLGGLSFMPEMAALCGKRFTVERRAERVCDTVNHTGSRRLRDAVLLDDLRCDGSGHDGCQAECRLFWKEAWLRKVDDESRPAPAVSRADVAALMAKASRNARRSGAASGETRYRCQATELPQCTEAVRFWDPRSYVREFTSGNVSLGRFLRVTSRAAVQEPLRKLGFAPEVHVPGQARKGDRFEPLNLQPGEWVRVKARDEIARTLDPQGRNKGLWFDREMLPYCGGTFRVRQRVSRFVDDRDGRMVTLKTDAVTLDGVICSGELSLLRWFCPRAIYPYWRECWLERVEPAAEQRERAGAERAS
jgi:hypothetical protein